MKIMFIYPDTHSIFPRHYQVGIGSLSAILKKHNHETRLAYIKDKRDILQMWHKIEDWRPEIIGFSTTTAMTGMVRDLSMKIKNRFPDIYQICGGIHPTLCPEFLDLTPSLDAICRGEAEEALLDFVEKFKNESDFNSTENFWLKSNSTIIKNRLRSLITNLEGLPYPDREIFDYGKIMEERGEGYGRAAEFLFMRGCPFSCSYCNNSSLRKIYNDDRYVRWPTTEWAIGQIQDVVNRYPTDVVYIHDDTFGLNKEWFYEFLDGYKNHINLRFWINMRIGDFDSEMAKFLKEAGCFCVTMGVESGSEKIRTGVLNRMMSNQQIISGFKLFEKYGIQTYSQNMVGLPYETPIDFLETIKLNAAIIPNAPGVGIFQPYPGTKLAEACEENRWIVYRSGDFLERTDTILKMPKFKRKHILFYYHYFNLLVRRMWRAQNKKSAFFERLIPILPPYFWIILLHENLISIIEYIRKIYYKICNEANSLLKRNNAGL